MKFLLIHFTVLSLQLGATGYSQGISVSLKNASLVELFKSVELQTDYRFVYSEEAITLSRPISIDVKGENLENVLRLCFSNQPLAYTIDDKLIILRIVPKKKVPETLTIEIKGKVVNENGESLQGVTIAIKNSDRMTFTDDRGEFSFKDLRGDESLVITSIGYYREEIVIGNQTNFLIRLNIAVGSLDETIITAYGKTTRRLNTGNIARISSSEISQQPVANPLSTMQGRMSGVFINTQNGMPGGNITVQIRGKGSINAGTDPLYVIDGVPFISTPLNATTSVLTSGIGGSTSPLNSVNPSDIESIEVLKDAEATALYGSRAANGVVLITTKKGKAGRTKFDLNIYHGISGLSSFPDLLNTSEYLQIRREAFKNDGITPTISNAPDLLVWDSTRSINWPKYMLGRTAPVTEVKTEISGGNEFLKFLISANVRNEGTILSGNQCYQREGAHVDLQYKSLNKKLSFDFSSVYTTDVNKLLSSAGVSILTLPPNLPLYDNAGNYNWVGISDVNPAALLKRKSISRSENLLSNLILRYAILPDLHFKTSFGYTTIRLDQVMTYPLSTLNPNFGLSNSAYYGDNRNKTYLVEPQLEYAKKIRSYTVEVLLGATWQNNVREGQFLSGSNYSNDDLLENAGAAGTISVVNLYSQYKYSSIFARLHFDYQQKYLFNINARRDGSSRFGPGDQFGNFGSVSGGWIFSNETFFKNIRFVSYGKLRMSYGITGNDQIADYQYLSTYRSGSVYQSVAGLTPSRIANAKFGWEANKKFEFGIELGLLKDNVKIMVSWFNNRSGNQLIDYPLPYASGPFGTYQVNLPALVQNTGLEAELNATIIKHKRILLSLTGNITIPHNTLLNYPGLASSSFANTYVIGEDLSIRRTLKFTGIDNQTGLPVFYDVNHDGTIAAPADYTVVGKTSPYFFGGAGVNFRYGQFDLNIFFQFSKQYAPGVVDIPGMRKNNFQTVLARWQQAGSLTNVPKATTVTTGAYTNLAQSDASFFNASYVRLKNISASYRFPSVAISKLKLDDWRVYIEGQNLLTFHGASNLYDPETPITSIPPLRTIAFGIQLTF